MAVFRRLSILLAAVLCLATAHAQAPARTEPEQIRQDIAQLESQLSRNTQADSELAAMRGRIEPIIAALRDFLAREMPRLEEINARLTEIGPKPDAKAPPESAEVTKNRAEQESLKREVDEAIRVTRLLLVRAEQLQNAITDRRRAVFRAAVLQKSQSVASPWLWINVAEILPGTTDDLRAFFRFRVQRVIDHTDTLRLTATAILVVLICVATFPAMRAQRRFLALPPTETPSRLQKALWALRRTIVPLATPLAFVLAMLGMLDLLEIGADRLGEFLRTIIFLIPTLAALRALAQAILSPDAPAWRLPAMSDRTAHILFDLARMVAWIFVIGKALEAVNLAIAAALPVTIAMRGVAALLTSLIVLSALRRIESQAEGERDAHARTAARSPYALVARSVTLVAAIAMGVAALAGYIALSSFLTEQAIWIASVAALLMMLLTLTEEGVGKGLLGASPIGRNLRAATGLSAGSMQQIGILSSGLLHIALFAAAAMLVLAPWGVDSGDMLGSLKAAFFGFQVGGVHVSVSTLVVGLALFLIGFFVTRSVQRWLEGTYLPSTSLDIGLRNSIGTIFGYIGLLAAAILSLGYLGISLDKVTLVAGALSVGIGFGLQSIVGNFVSGLILLWERPIRVGDWIVVGDEQGKVKRINVRATEIETFDRASLIVPNSEFISGRVKNWMHNDRLGRIILPIGVSYAADPERARLLLLEVAKAHREVLADPEPRVFFMKLGESSLDFELRCFVDVDVMLQTRSDLLFEIHRRLKDEGIEVPYPRRTVEIADIDRLGKSIADNIPR